jgi:hypothetical protein
VVNELQGAKGTWPRVSAETGISRKTIEKIANRTVLDPRVSRVQRLANYFRNRQ